MLTGRRAFDGEDDLGRARRGAARGRRLVGAAAPARRRACARSSRAASKRDPKQRPARHRRSAGGDRTIEPARPSPGSAVSRLTSRRARLRVDPRRGHHDSGGRDSATLGLTRWLAPRAEDARDRACHPRLSIELPDGDEVGAPNLRPVAIAEDDSRVAYVGFHDGKRPNLPPHPQRADREGPRRHRGRRDPFFSPDGQMSAFAACKLGNRRGGAALHTLADAPFRRRRLERRRLHLLAPTNAEQSGASRKEAALRPKSRIEDPAGGEITHRWPHRRGRRPRYSSPTWTGPGDDEQNIAVQTLANRASPAGQGRRRAPLRREARACCSTRTSGTSSPYRGDRHRRIWAEPVPMNDARAGQTTSRPQRRRRKLRPPRRTGTLVYLGGGRSRNARRLVSIDRTGKVDPAPFPERNYEAACSRPTASGRSCRSATASSISGCTTWPAAR